MLARLLIRVACLFGSHGWLPDAYNGGFYCPDCPAHRDCR